MPTRPNVYPDFCLTGTRTAPGGSRTNSGYLQDDIPPAEEHNYLFGTTGDWIRWLDQVTQANIQSGYDATVGTGGSFPDINSLVAAITGGSAIRRVLVTTLQTLAATQIITSGIADLQLDWHPSAYYSKGGLVTPGLLIHGQRIRIRGGRWMNFNGGSDVAIQLASDSKNCLISDVLFFNCTNSLADAGTNNSDYGLIEEV